VIVPVFVHGSGFTGAIFADQRAAFANSHAPNLPGHDAPGGCSTIAEFADFIEAYLSRNGLHEVCLCGNSMGGAIALQVGLRQNARVRALALLGSGARLRVAPWLLKGLRTDFEGTVGTIASKLYAQPSHEDLSRAVTFMRNVGPAQTRADYEACNAFDVTERLAELEVPVLAIAGENDVMTPPKYAQFVAARVRDGRVRVVPGAGHLMMAERPSETNEALADFVQSVNRS